MQLVRFRAGGLAWRARADFRPGVEALCRELSDPGRIEGAVLIKASRARAVWKMRLADRSVYVKRYRVRGLSERLKYLVVRPRAAAEWRAASALAQFGIDAVEPLASGVARRGPWLVDGFFVAAELAGEPFHDAAMALRSRPGGVAALLTETVALYHALANSRILHPDLHGGNMLVRDEAGAPRIGLVDLHSLRFPRVGPLARSRMRRKLAHSLWGVLEDDEFESVLSQLAPGREDALREQVARVERVRLRSRSRRCVIDSTRFAVEREAGWNVWRRREVSQEALLALAADGEPSGARSLEIDGEECPVWLWRRRRPGWLPVWRGLHALGVRGIPTWTAWACLQRRSRGWLREAVLITEPLSGAVRLDRLDPDLPGEEDLMRAALATAGQLHRHGWDARVDVLFARRELEGWQVLCAPRGFRFPDRPLSSARASRELDLLRAGSREDQVAPASR
jgi:hypothetical protein